MRCMHMVKENRIHILMSDAELEALDEWRFANKIASRGEAIRRLIHRGIVPDEVVDHVKRSGKNES